MLRDTLLMLKKLFLENYGEMDNPQKVRDSSL